MKTIILRAFTLLGLNAAIAQTNGNSTDNNYNNNVNTPGTYTPSGTSTVTPRNSNGTYNPGGSYNSGTNNSNSRRPGDTTSTKMGSRSSTKRTSTKKSSSTYTHTPPPTE